MSNKVAPNDPTTLGRRGMLRNGLMLGSAAALALPLLGTGTAAAAPSVDQTHRRRAGLVLDIAVDGSNTTLNAGPRVNLGDLRGSTYHMEGPIYRGLTIPNGVVGWDLASHTGQEIGRWLGMGEFVSFRGRPAPKLHSVHTYILGLITADDNFPEDQLTSTGTEASITQDTKPSTRSITGGAGKHFGASGQITLYGNGSNLTDSDILGVVGKAPNLRLFFHFADRHDRP
jgi:hypothetical protein